LWTLPFSEIGKNEENEVAIRLARMQSGAIKRFVINEKPRDGRLGRRNLSDRDG
jgi:hypothetical protein